MSMCCQFRFYQESNIFANTWQLRPRDQLSTPFSLAWTDKEEDKYARRKYCISINNFIKLLG